MDCTRSMMNLKFGELSTKPMVFLETTACIGFSMRPLTVLVTGRKTAFLVDFINCCFRQRQLCRVVSSTTVQKEAKRRLRNAVNQKLTGLKMKRWEKERMLDVCRMRLDKLFSMLGKGLLEIKDPKVREVRGFYFKLRDLKDWRLFQLREEKGRVSLLPSRADMTILGEAARLAETHRVVLVTEDKDYTSFQKEIMREFHVKILSLYDIHASMGRT